MKRRITVTEQHVRSFLVDEEKLEAYYESVLEDKRLARVVELGIYDGESDDDGYAWLGEFASELADEAYAGMDVEILHYCLEHPDRLLEGIWRAYGCGCIEGFNAQRAAEKDAS